MFLFCFLMFLYLLSLIELCSFPSTFDSSILESIINSLVATFFKLLPVGIFADPPPEDFVCEDLRSKIAISFEFS